MYNTICIDTSPHAADQQLCEKLWMNGMHDFACCSNRLCTGLV